MCNEIEQLAVQSGAAVVFGAHYSKGNQAGKDAIDRIGGSGVFARDPDVILTMTPHEEKDAYVIDLTLRALPQLDPFVVRWSSCLFQRDPAADPTRIKTATPGKRPQASTSYKSGSVAAKYGALLATMPPLGNDHDASLSAVVGYVCDVVAGVDGKCDLAEGMRPRRCGASMKPSPHARSSRTPGSGKPCSSTRRTSRRRWSPCSMRCSAVPS